MSALVGHSQEVAAIAAEVARAPLVAFDLEFLAQDRLVPKLCLVQVSWDAADTEVRLVDALSVDVRPLLAAIAEHPLPIAHAARQDLGIVAAQFQLAIPHIVDSQVMAAFAGLGDQIGLAALTSELLGVTLAKDSQWSDWAARPLSPAQLAYATSDVLHLPSIYRALATRLGHRVAWARAESGAIAAEAVAAAATTPETAWRNVGGLRGLDAATLAAVRALAGWRHRIAHQLDRPLGWVLNDRALLDLARARPREPDRVRAVKGISAVVRNHVDEVIDAIHRSAPDDGIVIAAARQPSPRAQRWGEVLFAIAHAVASEYDLAVRLIATRDEAERFARGFDEQGRAGVADHPAITTWRRDVIGDSWLGWLEGRLTLAQDANTPSGLRVITIG